MGKMHVVAEECLTGDTNRMAQRIWSRCGRIRTWRYNHRDFGPYGAAGEWRKGIPAIDAARLFDERTFSSLPRRVQCDYCFDLCPRSASPEDIVNIEVALHLIARSFSEWPDLTAWREARRQEEKRKRLVWLSQAINTGSIWLPLAPHLARRR